MEKNKRSAAGLLLLFMLLLPVSGAGQQQPAIDWVKGPTTADLGGIAELQIPEGFMFTAKKGTQKLLELTQNIPNGNEVGAIVPAVRDDEKVWFVVFEFSEVGFVRDDEKSDLHEATILENIQDATEHSNEIRKEKGWPAYHVIGWENRPFYDQKTNNLTWAIHGRDDAGSESINHSIRILGRHGTMNVDLVLAPQQYASVVPQFNALMTAFQFRQGSRYADFVSGDKVAAYGLTALIAGGAGAVAVKTGLLMKLWKFIVVIVLALKKALIVIFVALGAAIKKLWNRIRGRGKEQPIESSPVAETPVEHEPATSENESAVSSSPKE